MDSDGSCCSCSTPAGGGKSCGLGRKLLLAARSDSDADYAILSTTPAGGGKSSGLGRKLLLALGRMRTTRS